MYPTTRRIGVEGVLRGGGSGIGFPKLTKRSLEVIMFNMNALGEFEMGKIRPKTHRVVGSNSGRVRESRIDLVYVRG